MTVDASKLHVLAIHAHPDDIEFQCAGTLRRLRKLGCRITVATMTPGDCGSAEHNAEEIAAIRREEARRTIRSRAARSRDRGPGCGSVGHS